MTCEIALFHLAQPATLGAAGSGGGPLDTSNASCAYRRRRRAACLSALPLRMRRGGMVMPLSCVTLHMAQPEYVKLRMNPS